MANRFYIRPRNTALDFGQMALRLAAMKQQGSQFEKTQALSEREQATRERVSEAEYGHGDDTGGATGLAQRREARAQREVSAQERLAAAKESEPMQQFSRYMTGKPQPARLIGLSKQFPAFEPIVNTILDGIGEGQINDRWDVYYRLKGSEAIHLQTARDRFEKEIESLTKKGKHTQAAQLGEIYNQLRPGFLEQFFGFPQEMMPEQVKMSMAKGGTPGSIKGYAPGSYLFTPEGESLGKLPERPEKEPTLEKIASAEALIRSDVDEKGNEIDPTAKKGWVTYFNTYSDQPYVYFYKKGREVDKHRRIPDEIMKVDLPKDPSGKQVTAKEVMQTAKKRKMTLEDVLRAIGALQ